MFGDDRQLGGPLRLLQKFLLILTLIGVARAAPCVAGNGVIAVTPRAVWMEGAERQDLPNGLMSSTSYLFRENGIKALPDLRGNNWPGSLSPDGSLIAFEVNRVGDGRAEMSAYEVVVTDTSGRMLASIRGGVRTAWSSHGQSLAVGIGCAPWFPVPPFDSVVVWEPARGMTFSRHVPASRGLIGWAGRDTILIGPSILGPEIAVGRRTGKVTPSWHMGTDISPDGRYSAYFGGRELVVHDDTRRFDLTPSIVSLFGIRKVSHVGPGCWVRPEGRHQVLALSVCGSWSGRWTNPYRECRTGLVDIDDRTLLGWARGRLIGPISASPGVAVVHGSTIHFMRHGDWFRSPVPPDTTSGVVIGPKEETEQR